MVSTARILGIFTRFCKQIPTEDEAFCTDTYVLDPLKKVTIFLSYILLVLNGGPTFLILRDIYSTTVASEKLVNTVKLTSIDP
jgi:hypothetical protein